MTPEERATAVCRDSRWTIEPWKYDLIVAAIRAAIEAERESCAQIVEGFPAPSLVEWIAAAIRDRSENT